MTNPERHHRGSTPRRGIERDASAMTENGVPTMTNETERDAADWTDSRARQDTLPNERPRSDRETRIDSGGSESFADDRNGSDGTDAGEQAALGAEHVDDGNQRDLTGSRASEEAPEWAEGDR